MKAFRFLLVRASLVFAFLIAFPAAEAGDPDAVLWAALESGGHVALMRHALAPGTGDPDNFRIDDCATQRNLSETGRKQAREIGAQFREHGVANVAVYSSQWCRCLETAKLLGLGKVTPFAALNSFFQGKSREAAQSAEVRKIIREYAKGSSLALVTHQVNITALTGVFPQSGEIVVLRPEGDKLVVLGSILAR